MFMKFLEISGKILLMNKVFSILIKRYFDFGNDIIFLLNGCKICIISPSILSGLFMSLSQSQFQQQQQQQQAVPPRQVMV